MRRPTRYIQRDQRMIGILLTMTFASTPIQNGPNRDFEKYKHGSGQDKTEDHLPYAICHEEARKEVRDGIARGRSAPRVG
jgi:hypothetical protein